MGHLRNRPSHRQAVFTGRLLKMTPSGMTQDLCLRSRIFLTVPYIYGLPFALPSPLWPATLPPPEVYTIQLNQSPTFSL